MNSDNMEISIAATAIGSHVPKDAPLKERIEAAMRYAVQHEGDVFWMSYRVTDDLRLKAALTAVMAGSSDEDRDTIRRSLKPLQMLNAAMSGIPVDFLQMDTDNILPLVQMLNDAKGVKEDE